MLLVRPIENIKKMIVKTVIPKFLAKTVDNCGKTGDKVDKVWITSPIKMPKIGTKRMSLIELGASTVKIEGSADAVYQISKRAFSGSRQRQRARSKPA